MNNIDPMELRKAFKEQFGFYPPCNVGAAELGEDMERIIGEYHHLIWGEGAIPLKYRYLIALATAVYSEDDTRAKLELIKAVKSGATREEIVEVLRQQVWMRGAPLIVKIIPLLKFLERIDNVIEKEA
ncbi:carboxymuconolactone decarboxylase family protein [Dendrosporobacter sp. 1207_IL3150]|uniref:carboxymuconolactone decarboxylase family protein n=1 Tax=Dendrosporobacter sp. 1207_IL3150 TaxID=3084054 RepID=UPI002FDAD187